MKHSPLKAKLRKAIKRLVAAEVADSWKGGGAWESIPNIEAELKEAKKRLRLVLLEVDDILQANFRGRFPHLFN